MDPTEDAVPTEDVTAPVADQPDVTTPTDAPETPAAEEPTVDTPEADEPEGDEESFTDIDPETLPEEAKEPYKRLQADYTRKTQALAERHAELDQAVSFVSDLVSDEANDTQEQVFRILAERLGYDVEGDEEGDEPDPDEPEGDTPAEFRDPRLDPILAEREAKAAADAEAEFEAELDGHEATINDGITKAAKVDQVVLDKAEHDVVFDLVLALPAKDGGPDVAGAYARYKAATQADRDRWVKSKTTGSTPGGDAPETPVDLHNEEQRQAHMARSVEAARRAQSGL